MSSVTQEKGELYVQAVCKQIECWHHLKLRHKAEN